MTYALALRRISLTRPSSLAPFPGSLILRASSLMVPRRAPTSISACLTQVRSTSGGRPARRVDARLAGILRIVAWIPR